MLSDDAAASAMKNPIMADSREEESFLPMPVSSKVNPTTGAGASQPAAGSVWQCLASRKVLVAIAITSALVLCIATAKELSLTNISKHSNGNEANDAIIDSSNNNVLYTGALGISIANEYSSTGNTMFPYPFLNNSLLIEPYRDHTMTVTGLDSDEDCEYDWMMKGGKTDAEVVSGTTRGGTSTVSVNTTGMYTLQLVSTCTGEGTMANVWVKYVRRELMSLTEDDREEFLDALSTLWQVSTVEGQARFGAAYKSLYYFAAIHNDAGGNSQCDEFHGKYTFSSIYRYVHIPILIDKHTYIHIDIYT